MDVWESTHFGDVNILKANMRKLALASAPDPFRPTMRTCSDPMVHKPVGMSCRPDVLSPKRLDTLVTVYRCCNCTRTCIHLRGGYYERRIADCTIHVQISSRACASAM